MRAIKYYKREWVKLTSSWKYVAYCTCGLFEWLYDGRLYSSTNVIAWKVKFETTLETRASNAIPV